MGDTAKELVGAGGASVSLGKGAWDCDNNCEIPPDKEAEVFEEIATMEFPFEGIPTIPPRKDVEHISFFCDGCRYRVKGGIDEKVAAIKQRLWEGGCGRGGEMSTGKRKVIESWQSLVLIFAGQQMADEHTLRDYHVPEARERPIFFFPRRRPPRRSSLSYHGSKCMIAIDKRLIDNGGKPDPDSAYWN